MEREKAEVGRKRMRQSVEEKQLLVADAEVTVGEDAEATVGEETETEVPLSEQMQLDIARIHEKIDSFTNLVSELMESGKSLLLEISNQFVERLISIHKEQTEKWQEEIRELRLLDASNEETNNILHSARYVLHNGHIDS
ncbi:Knotted 1-binding protein 36 [Heracleum sosnowskyi]|uniref:Knotted 1-binding protein 36 n=1 Tax=Heracleum sosnowskyi TaxID=360622 RepID=A0AAD8GUD9_9APIA|nr:Knotted 1-binding protein 36 [Heracleum sosnowskyi]